MQSAVSAKFGLPDCSREETSAISAKLPTGKSSSKLQDKSVANRCLLSPEVSLTSVYTVFRKNLLLFFCITVGKSNQFE